MERVVRAADATQRTPVVSVYPTGARSVRRLDSPRWPFLYRGLLPALGLFVVALFGVTRFANSWIEEHARTNIGAALEAAEFGWAELSVSGQKAVLSGSAPSASAGGGALEVARAATCPTWLGEKTCAISVSGAFEAGRVAWPDLRGTTDGDVLTLNGQVHDEAMRATLLDVAQEAVDGGRVVRVVDQLTLAPEGVPASFDVMASRVAKVASLCETGGAALTGGTFSVQCRVSRAFESQIRALVQPPLPSGSLGDVHVLIAEDAAACEGRLASLLENSRIEFASGSATIVSTTGPLLDRIVEAARTCPGTLRVEGHTDNTGNADANQRLSAARAEAVREALGIRGFSLDRLVAVGFGQANPVASNTTLEGRARNRRIELRVTLDDN